MQHGSKDGDEEHNVYTQAANGSLPLVIEVYNEDDIAQLILVKREFTAANIVVYGGHSAALVSHPYNILS